MYSTATAPGRDGTQDIPARKGAVSLWAVLGALWIAFVGQAWLRWIASDTLFRRHRLRARTLSAAPPC